MNKESKMCTPLVSPAQRVNSVSEYYFSRKLKEIAEMNAAGKKVLNLGIGNPDLPPSEKVIQTLCKHAMLPSEHGYQPYVGLPELRQAFANWYQQFYDVSLDASTEIQPLIGSKEGVLHVSLAFLNEGDGVLIPNPGYPTYRSVSKLVGAVVHEYELSEQKGWMPDFDALERMDLSRVKLMWVNYPHMPTGTNATVEVFERLVAFGKRHGIVICNDNPYSFILNETPRSILSVPCAKEICIEMNSLSKSHNMAGWRIAMLASNSQFIQWILRVKSNVDSGQFKPIQHAAVEALQATNAWYEQQNDLYALRRKTAEAIAHALGCSFDVQQVGLFLWAKIPDTETDAETLCERILHKARVFITPGFIFGTQGERYIRISLCCNETTFAEALNRIRETYKV